MKNIDESIISSGLIFLNEIKLNSRRRDLDCSDLVSIIVLNNLYKSSLNYVDNTEESDNIYRILNGAININNRINIV